LGTLLSLLVVNFSHAQKLVKDLKFTPENAKIEFTENETKGYLVEIGGPNTFYWSQEIEYTKDIILPNKMADGKDYADGTYTLQITPIYTLTAEQKQVLQQFRVSNDQKAIAQFRTENNLPTEADVYSVSFGIRNGHFVLPQQKEAKMNMPVMSSWNANHPSMYASINPIVAEIPTSLVKDNSGQSEDAQVIATDLVVQGSACFGFDCVNGESFGFDTNRLKENNLRIHFDDTSASASFPSNDWRIAANDTSNGGDNFLAIQDATAGTTPFKVEAGAGNNALHVDASGGNVGFGTATPVVELHVADGDTPTLRLEQNGSNGWTPQTWDIAGNETNFFVRDVNNSSNLIFRLRAGAPANSIFVQNNGRVGLGTDSPSDALHVKSGNVRIESGELILNNGGINLPTGNFTVGEGTSPLDVQGFAQFNGPVQITGTTTLRGNLTASNSTGSSTVFHIDHTNTRVGIGTSGPNHLLELSADDAVKPNGGSWSGPSDRRLKKDITSFTEGLSSIMKFRPVEYRYNGILGLPTNETFVGLIAQEVQEIAPHMIKDLNPDVKEGEEKYLAVNPTAMTYMLVNAVKEQQEIIQNQQAKIEALEGQLASIEALKAQVAALAEVENQSQGTDEGAVETIGEERD